MTPISRRQVVKGAVIVGGLHILGACSRSDERSGDPSLPPTSIGYDGLILPDVDVAFAEPWAHRRTDDVILLGVEVFRVVPTAIDHARQRLTATGESSPAAEDTLRSAFMVDAADGSLTDVGGWMMPTTLAGLAGGLAALRRP